MIVLGIADNHDSGAALAIDGQLVAAVNQERLDRVKGSAAFPWAAIDETLRVAGVRAQEVDRVALGSSFTPSTALRMAPTMHANARGEGQFSRKLHAYVVYQSALRGLGLHTWEVDASRKLMLRRLAERPFDRAELEMCDHHASHAHGAYRTQGLDRCLVFTVDAMGDGTSATVSIGRGGELQQLWRQSGMAAINSFYSRVTELLGFKPNRHEGKITGLAAYVEPPHALLTHMRKRLAFKAPGFTRMPVRRREHATDPFWAEVARWDREQIAAAAQRVLEEAVSAFVAWWIERTGCADVAVAGGIFANVKLNQRLAELPTLRSLWVMPHMGDGGLPAGAALGVSEAAPTPLASAALGPEWGRADLYKALKRQGVSPEQHDVNDVAALLAEGRVVARYDGRMEWGPRALGQRSILARPQDPGINDRLNAQLDRSEFMPFAPLVRAEDADRWFVGVDKAAQAARYMTVCFDATDAFKAACPAVVHVDGTARPQLLDREHDPALHALLTRVGELTGTPVLINTSFNRHEEPIVCTPDEGVKAWAQAGLDALWMGPYLATRAERPA